MTRRGVAFGLVLFVCSAAVARPQGVEIDHKEVGCIVVGKYPKMNACFTPAASLARSRVYFRPEGTPSWYYVDMKSDQPCFTGILPRPGKKLVGKKIEYYVEAQDKTFNPARTAEYGPVVVQSAQECKKDVPVAPFLNNATVAVFPSVPAGFVGGGIGTAAVVGIAAAGAAAAGTAAVVATSNNNDTTTTTVAVVINTTTTTTTLAPTTTTTTPPRTNRPPFAVLTTNPDPASGNGPLTVTFDLCKSTDPDGDPLNFFFDFGDGGKSSGSCNVSHTYSATFREASNVRSRDRSYSAEGCVVDPGDLSACRTRNVTATTPTPACVPATPTVVINVTSPPRFASAALPPAYCNPLMVSATATNADKVTFSLDFIDFCDSTPKPNVASKDAFPPDFAASFDLSSPGLNDCYDIKAQAFNCGGASAAAVPVSVEVDDCSTLLLGPTPKGVAQRTAGWSSDLTVEGGALQMVVNGTATAFPRHGRVFGLAPVVDGENRVEATLVESSGKAGLWRVDLLSTEAATVGSIRVIAGEVAEVGPSSVTFRLTGTRGERVAFTFVKN